MYNRYAESARVNWTRNFAVDIDPKHRKEWTELMTPKSLGLILRSITTNYKFVCANTLCRKQMMLVTVLMRSESTANEVAGSHFGLP